MSIHVRHAPMVPLTSYETKRRSHLNSTLCYKGGMRLIFAECEVSSFTRGENGRPPEKHAILFFPHTEKQLQCLI